MEIKKALEILTIVACVAFGLYVGLWWAFIGGVVDLIQAIRATELVAMDVAIGMAKVMSAGMIISVSGFVAVVSACAFFKKRLKI